MPLNFRGQSGLILSQSIAGDEMKIECMNKETANRVHAEVKTALKEVADRFGLNLKASGCRYSDTRFTCSVDLEVMIGDGVPATFLEHCRLFNLEHSDFGRVFRNRGTGDLFSISGINNPRSKYPITAQRLSDGVSCKFAVPTDGFVWEGVTK